MIEIKLTPTQTDWLEASWTEVTQAPDVVTPATPERTITLPPEEIEPGVFSTVMRTQVVPGTPEKVQPGAITRVELKHTSYHPTQLDLLQADAAAMGTPLDGHMDMLVDWVNGYVPPAPEPVPVPAKVTMRQARLALLAAGKLAAVSAAIEALPSPQKEAAQIEWEYSQEVQRHNGFVSLLAPVLGMDDEALDQLFIIAAGL